MTGRMLIAASLAVAAGGCCWPALAAAATPVAAADAAGRGCIDTVVPGTDYFPDKVALDYAENFSVAYHDTYRVVTVHVPAPGQPPDQYVLVRCGAPVPELGPDLAGAVVIETPVWTVYSSAASANAALAILDALDRLTGIDSTARVSNPDILARAESGRVIQYAPQITVDAELVIEQQPDLVVVGGENEGLSTVRAAGIPVVTNADWLETSALARSEWIKFMAVFLDLEAEAEAVFAEIDESYWAAAALAAGVPETERPLVMSGSTYQGTFYAAGGRSYVAEEIVQAGGRYVFADNTDTGSTQFADLEPVLELAAPAEIWLHANATFRSLTDIEAMEPRLAALPAAQAGQVWNPDRLAAPNGALVVYELGVVRPDLVLQDLIEILHPDLTDHELMFYRTISVD